MPNTTNTTNHVDDILRRRYGLNADREGSATNVASVLTLKPTPPTDTTNFYQLTERAKKLMADKKWQEAKVPLQKLIQFYPTHTGPDNALLLLAEAHRHLNETNHEREVLAKLAALDADALEVFLRLMELAAEVKDWSAVAQNAERFLAVNPLLGQPHRFLAQAREESGDPKAAIESYQTLLLLDPPDPAEVHFRLARLVHQAGDPSAKRHLLQTLEDAPRFREAHRLLLELTAANTSKSNSTDKPTPVK